MNRYDKYAKLIVDSDDLTEVRDKLSSSLGKYVDVMPCKKLHAFSNLKCKLNLGKLCNADDSNAHYIYSEQKNWIGQMGFLL